MQYHAVPLTAKQYHTVQCSTLHYITCSTLHDMSLHCIAMHRNTSLYIAFQLHCHHTCTQYDMIPRNVVGDGSRIKPGMHKWPGEPPTNATSQNDVFTCLFCICLEKQLQLSCNRIAYKSQLKNVAALQVLHLHLELSAQGANQGLSNQSQIIIPRKLMMDLFLFRTDKSVLLKTASICTSRIHQRQKWHFVPQRIKSTRPSGHRHTLDGASH